MGVYLQTTWLWVWIPLQSLKLQIWCLLRARSSLTFTQTIECRFTLNLICNTIITYSHKSVLSIRSSHLKLVNWHFGSHMVSRPFKGHYVIGLGLSTSTKLTVIWLILECCYHIVDLILVFYCKFCASKNE